MATGRIKLLGSCLALSCLLCCVHSVAQETYDRAVMGHVKGSAGEPLAGANVTLKNLDKGTSRRAATDPHGGFSFNHLSSTTRYEVAAEYRGKHSQVEKLDSGTAGKNIVMTLTLETDPTASPAADTHDRAIIGRVVDGQGRPFADAVVVLKNSQTATMKKMNSDHEGAFRFMHLSTKVGYTVRAVNVTGRTKSDIQNVSPEDHRKTVALTLELAR